VMSFPLAQEKKPLRNSQKKASLPRKISQLKKTRFFENPFLLETHD
jgi:hypothetical protein